LIANFLPPRVYLSQDAEDAAIVVRCLGGETAAFELLVDRYQRPLFTAAARMLGSRDDAADATQNAFVRIYQNLQSFRPEYRFFSWAYRILVNECSNMMRRRRDGTDPGTAPVASRGAFELLETSERRQAVQRALLELPHDLRAVIVLRHYGGLSYEEIGEALDGLAVKTVKSRLHTARQRLGQRLTEWAVSDER
jgi:RNA polymerase sigma-70 factor (ECF subfamily)